MLNINKKELLKKILTIGGATQDIFLNYQNPQLITLQKDNQAKEYLILEDGSKVDIKNLTYYTGGGSTNSAVSLKKLGLDVTCFFKIGKDCQAEYILSELKKYTLKTEIAVSNNLPTAVSFILPTIKDRIVLAYRGVNIDISQSEIPIKAIKSSDIIYITSLSGKSAELILPITKISKENNIIVATNPGMSQLKDKNSNFLIDSLKNIDILILNYSESEQLYLSIIKESKKFEIKDYFKLILTLGPSIIAVTNGEHGVHVADKNNIYFHESIKPEKLVNTLGAGDSFGSCFVGSLMLGKSIQEALLYGIINASSVISHEGAKTGLLNLQEIENKAKNIGNKIMKIS